MTRIRITQFMGSDHEFGSVEEYEQFMRTTNEELVHLEEYVQIGDEWVEVTEGAIPELDEMWLRLYKHEEEV